MLGLLRVYYDNVTQNVRSSTTVQVQSKLWSDICRAACLWWFFKHRFTVLALHSTHREPVTSASAAHTVPPVFERDMMGLRANPQWCNCRGRCWRTPTSKRGMQRPWPTEPTVAHRVLFVCGWPSAVDFVACPSLLAPLAAVPACCEREFSDCKIRPNLTDARWNIIVSIWLNQFHQIHSDMKMVGLLCISLLRSFECKTSDLLFPGCWVFVFAMCSRAD